MEYRYLFGFVLVALLSIMLPDAYAAIGGIGSPVVPSNLPPVPNATRSDLVKNKTVPAGQTANKNSGEEDRQSLLVIDFNQRHVYFEHQLKQAVSGTESSQADATYDVVSRIPSENVGKLKTEHLSDAYASNLNDVVTKMQDLGVSSARIRVSTETSDDVTTQQITVYVK